MTLGIYERLTLDCTRDDLVKLYWMPAVSTTYVSGKTVHDSSSVDFLYANEDWVGLTVVLRVKFKRTFQIECVKILFFVVQGAHSA